MRTVGQPNGDWSRRGFLGASGAALICTIGGKPLEEATHAQVKRSDAAASELVSSYRARSVSTKAPGRDPVDSLKFGTPEPQPGGAVREYWIEARTHIWDPSPTGRDEWMGMKIPAQRTFRAFLYQQFSPGFAEPVGPALMPGPTMTAEVGDVLRVHVRNGDTVLNQAITMHPHGVKYTPDYDGTYLGDFTRIGGFIAPGEEFTYTWEAGEDSVGVWPYHDHGPNHTINTFRGLFGAIIVREKGATVPDVETVLFQHSFPPQVTGLKLLFQCVNGRTAAGNTPTVRAKVGQDVAWHVIGGDNMQHTFHIHGHRWKAPAGEYVDNPSFGPHEPVSARYIEDNPGRWLYHCHVFSHQDAGMAGWYLVEP